MRSAKWWRALVPLAVAVVSSWAAAQQASQQNIRGTIARLDGQNLLVDTADGSVTVAMRSDTPVRTLVKKTLADIHPGDLVGTTSVPGDDGKLHAVEIHLFPAGASIAERQYPSDLTPRSIMTNAHVTGLAKAAQGQLLDVDYKNGTAEVIVDASTEIVAFAPYPGSLDDLQPGKAVYINANRSIDGALTATRMTVEKNGVKPPM
jgi:hypothetical protein